MVAAGCDGCYTIGMHNMHTTVPCYKEAAAALDALAKGQDNAIQTGSLKQQWSLYAGYQEENTTNR
eukprot:1157877-Pelagomonas_calceolata.AAC.7